MKTLLRTGLILPMLLLGAAFPAVGAEKAVAPKTPSGPATPLPEDYSCIFCHADPERLPDGTPNLLVTAKNLAGDVHWKKGLRCHDCHGGNPVLDDFVEHRRDPSFHSLVAPEGNEGKKPAPPEKGKEPVPPQKSAPQKGTTPEAGYARQIPGFCGRCHSDIQYMRRYNPSPRTDQESEYWTSGHGQRLKATGDAKVATCVSCHNKPHGNSIDKETHGVVPVANLESPVYPTNVATTCAHCHADEELMAKRKYHGRPIGHEQYAQWKTSVHGVALLKNGDLSAATCNDCHGNHGAVPPQVDSVANACGTCHGKVASLFAQTRMKHDFAEVGLPGCATCHGSHAIRTPTDEMLGLTDVAFCEHCHGEGKSKYGTTLREKAKFLKVSPEKLIAGAKAVSELRRKMDDLKRQIDDAQANVERAGRLGMEVNGPQFDLRKAFDALTDARTQIHTFARAPVEKALDDGFAIASEVDEEAQAALEEHTFRRMWLAATLVPILAVIVLLVLYIRTLPAPRP